MTEKPTFGFRCNSDKINLNEAELTEAKRVAGFWEHKKREKDFYEEV